MKVKLKAVAVAVLVLALQLFSAFVPCMAAAAGETSAVAKVVSFSNTRIFADLVDPEIYAEGKTAAEVEAGEEAAAAELLQKYPKDASKGTGDVQIVSSVLQESTSGRALRQGAGTCNPPGSQGRYHTPLPRRS